MNYEIRKNDQFNSNEIYFDSIPSKATREALKGIGCRWHNVKKCWYTRKSEEMIRNAINGTPSGNVEPVNEYGIKVGDVFYMSWGYDQTNNNFFQVVAVTPKKVKVVEVCPSYEAEATGPMAENRTLTYKEGEMLPRVTNSYWINDNENGDLKSVRQWGNSSPDIVISSRGHYTAIKCHTGQKVYESWYA